VVVAGKEAARSQHLNEWLLCTTRGGRSACPDPTWGWHGRGVLHWQGYWKGMKQAVTRESGVSK